MFKNYWIHLRPKTFFPSFVFVLTGYALNPGKGQTGSMAWEIISLFLIYSVLLFGGSCALNTHFDEDTGPLTFLENPPEKPQYLAQLGLILMALACLWSWFLGAWPFTMTVFATLLSIVYSARIPRLKWRGKEIGGLDVVIDALGCGVVGVILGATVSGSEPSFRTILVSIAFTFTVAGSYPATQIFQLKASDNYDTGRNFSTLLGAARALRIGSLLLALGFTLIWYTIFKDELLSYLSWRGFFYFGFSLIFLSGLFQCLRWSKNPFKNSTAKFKSVVFTLLGARLCWIAAEWLRGP